MPLFVAVAFTAAVTAPTVFADDRPVGGLLPLPVFAAVVP